MVQNDPMERPMRIRDISKEETGSLIFIVAIFSFIAVVAVLSLVLKKPRISTLEKRPLAALPALTPRAFFSGNYTRELSLHYSDTFPFRDQMLRYHHWYDDLKGFKYDDLKIYHAAPAPEEDEEEEDEASVEAVAKGSADDRRAAAVVELGGAWWRALLPSASAGLGSLWAQNPEKTGLQIPDLSGHEVPPKTAGNPDLKTAPVPDASTVAPRVEQAKNVVVYGNAAFYIYGGSTKTATRYAAVVSNAATVLANKARVYCLLVPTAIEIDLPSKYASCTNSQRTLMKHIFGSLQNVTSVDVYNSLVSHKGQYLYFRTDHHWTARGAYYAYEDFAKAVGYTPGPLSSYQEIEIGKFWGTLYAATRNSALGRHPDVVTAFKPAGSYTVTNYNEGGRKTGSGHIVYEYAKNLADKYVAFLVGDFAYIEIINNGTPKRDKKLLVLKESFGNVFVPFLAPDYKEIHVADIRHFPYGLASFVTAHGIDEVLIINNMFAASDTARIRELKKIVERN